MDREYCIYIHNLRNYMVMIKCIKDQCLNYCQIANSVLFRRYSTYCGRCSLGHLSSSVFPRLGFLELEAAVSDGSDSSQLSVVLATVFPQRRRPLFSIPIPPPPTVFSLPPDAAFCRGRRYNKHPHKRSHLIDNVYYIQCPTSIIPWKRSPF